jgi:hypothetical protein
MHLIPLLILALAVVWFKPGLVLTPGLVNTLFDKYGAEYFSKKPDGLKLEIHTTDVLSKHILIDASNFCLKEPDACFDRLHLETSLTVIGVPKIRVDDVGPIEVRNRYFHYAAKKEAEPTPSPSPKEPSQMVTIADDFMLKDVLIDFPKVEVRQEKDTLRASANIQKNQSDQLRLVAQAASDQGLRADARIQTHFSLTNSNPFSAILHYQQDPAGAKAVDGNLAGNLSWNTLHGDVAGRIEARGMVPWVKKLIVQNLKITRQEKLRLRADIEALVEPDVQPGNAKSALPPAVFRQMIRGRMEADETDGKIEYGVNVDPVPQQGLVIETRAKGHYPYGGPKDKSFFGLERFVFRFAIPEFQHIVQRFHRTSMAVPAPFNAMAGPMEFMVGDVDKNVDGASLPLKFTTDLNSPQQAIITRTAGKVDYEADTGAIHINGGTHLKLVKMTLPDLELFEPVPIIKYDNRIVNHDARVKARREQQEERQAKKGESRNTFNWKMTSDSGAVQIYHDILKPYAPIDVNWQVGTNPSGEVSLQPFIIEVLKRQAKVTKMRFYQNPGDGTFNYEGRLVVKKTEYTIFIDVKQVASKPVIQLTSSPPLAESDIVSVLLFNQTAAQLDSDQSSSVGSTQSAIANRALGLFSIMALSSTPVEAVNYNAGTGVYSARVKLADGLTASVGTDWDHTQEVALRKRIGGNFVLSTILQTSSDDTGDTRKTLIEWFRRF